MNGLLDFARGANNAVASTVSAPVDLISWGLRKAGLPIPQNAVGGSQWMAEQGLTVQPQNQTAGLLGEVAGSVAPTVVAAKAPQIAKGLLQMGENAMAPRTLNPQAGVVVFHGSPHKFDKFDSSKIGTGEGAQAYGHGLYFAESPDVAKSYQFAGQPGHIGQQTHGIAAAALRAANGDKKKALDLLNEQAMAAAPNARQPYWDAMNNFDDLVQPKSGVLYKVDLPDEAVAKMLDWDKPLSEQSEAVRSALEAIEDPMFRAWQKNGAWPYVHGETLYRHLADGLTRGAHEAGKHVGASQQLRSAGLPGIRYLDGGSRGAGQGTYNYVVFPGEEGLLSILGRE